MRVTSKLLLLVILIITLTAASSITLLGHQVRHFLQENQREWGMTLAATLSESIAQNTIDRDKIFVTELLRTIAKDQAIQYSYVTDMRGELFAHSFEGGFPRSLLEKLNKDRLQENVELSNTSFQSEYGLIEEINTPVIEGLPARLYIGINQEEVNLLIGKLNVRISLAIALTGLLGVLLATVLGKHFSAPLARFVKQLEIFKNDRQTDFPELASSDPDIKQITTMFKDIIVARSKAEARLRDREQNLNITLNSIGDGVIVTDHRGCIKSMNPVAEQLTAWSSEIAIGQPLSKIFPIIDASTRKPVKTPVEHVLSRGEIVHLSNHTTLLAQDGKEYQISDSAAPIRDAEGSILGVVLVFNDVTEQYKLRQQVDDSHKQLQQILKDMQTMVGTTTPDGRITYMNNIPLSMAGVKLEEVLDRPLWQCPWFSYDIEVQESIFNDCQRAANGEIVSRDIQIQTLNGPTWVEFNIHPVMDEHNKVIQLVPEGRNISDRKQAEQMLVRSQKMDALGNLTGGIAHDYNNVLGVILGYSELLIGELVEHPKWAGYAQKIYHASERGGKLTKKLLAFSKKQQTVTERVDLNTLLKDQQHMLEKTLTARIQLKMQLQPDLWPVRLDPNDLEDSILNLSINAMHAMPSGGQLTFTTCNTHLAKSEAQHLDIPPGDYVILDVTDSGCGMETELQNRIFDPFFSTKGDKGTGLGLSQVYGFVQHSKGNLKVYSEPGHGTCFSIYFPRYRKHGQAANQDQPRRTKHLKGTEYILVVDDEPAIRELAREILKSNGYKVRCAENASEALEILQNEPIDLMLSDIIMPEMNGFQLASIVQKKYPRIKIQMASGFSDNRESDSDNPRLHQNLLYKPFDSSTLLQRLRSLLDQPSQ